MNVALIHKVDRTRLSVKAEAECAANSGHLKTRLTFHICSTGNLEGKKNDSREKLLFSGTVFIEREHLSFLKCVGMTSFPDETLQGQPERV